MAPCDCCHKKLDAAVRTGGLLIERRKLLHERTAERWSRSTPTDSNDHSRELAHHYLEVSGRSWRVAKARVQSTPVKPPLLGRYQNLEAAA